MIDVYIEREVNSMQRRRDEIGSLTDMNEETNNVYESTDNQLSYLLDERMRG